MTEPRAALLVGASGLVGGRLLARLARDARYATVTVLTRRALGTGGGKVHEVVVDFDRPETLRVAIGGGDVFCCLGTTIKKAGSQDAFRKVDFEAPVAVAKAARAAGADQYVIVTAVGADAKSGVFYNRVKGETEAALAALAFPGGLKIVRPSLIMGERSERRPAERAAMFLMGATRPLFGGPLARYRAIDADDVAAAMLAAAREERTGGVHAYEGAPLFALAERETRETREKMETG
jgi:uncharacterized protein YbjT (DUF2867 family)